MAPLNASYFNGYVLNKKIVKSIYPSLTTLSIFHQMVTIYIPFYVKLIPSIVGIKISLETTNTELAIIKMDAIDTKPYSKIQSFECDVCCYKSLQRKVIF